MGLRPATRNENHGSCRGDPAWSPRTANPPNGGRPHGVAPTSSAAIFEGEPGDNGRFSRSGKFLHHAI
jgi:hypothetical protein